MPELSPRPARESTIALVTGLRLHVVEWGAADGWPLVILHGGGHDSGCWAGVCRRLPPELRCIVPDQRGHGASDRSAAGNYSCAAQVDDLVALLGEPKEALTGVDRAKFIVSSPSSMVSLMMVTGNVCMVAPGLKVRVPPVEV